MKFYCQLQRQANKTAGNTEQKEEGEREREIIHSLKSHSSGFFAQQRIFSRADSTEDENIASWGLRRPRKYRGVSLSELTPLEAALHDLQERRQKIHVFLMRIYTFIVLFDGHMQTEKRMQPTRTKSEEIFACTCVHTLFEIKAEFLLPSLTKQTTTCKNTFQSAFL